MTDETVEATPTPSGEIRIHITDTNVSYDSNMSPPEIVFWIDMVKHMILANIAGKEQVPTIESN